MERLKLYQIDDKLHLNMQYYSIFWLYEAYNTNVFCVKSFKKNNNKLYHLSECPSVNGHVTMWKEMSKPIAM